MVSSFICLEEACRPPLLYPFWRLRSSTAADRAFATVLSLNGPQLSGQSLVGAP